MTDTVVGIDPGPTPGIVVLTVTSGRILAHEVIQCSSGVFYTVLQALNVHHAAIGVERFVVRGRAARSSTAGAGEVTRSQVSTLEELYPQAFFRSASQVKHWATDERLEAAGLLDATKGMRHARDSARHALYTAVHGGHLTDPLSKKASTR